MPLVADTSAFAAIYRLEPGWERLQSALRSTERAHVPASCLVEAALLRRLGPEFYPWLEGYVSDPLFYLAEIDAPVARLAASTALVFGKGSGHAAKLNFGDCMSYAVAKNLNLPLLYTGRDFAETDIPSALIQE